MGIIRLDIWITLRSLTGKKPKKVTHEAARAKLCRKE